MHLFGKKEKKEKEIPLSQHGSTAKGATLKASYLARNSLKRTEDFVTNFPKRNTGGQDCKDCAKALEKELKEYCADAVTEEVSIIPDAYYFPMKMLAFSYPVLLLLNLIGLPLSSFAIGLFVLIIGASEFVFYKGSAGKLLKKKIKKGYNVQGSLEPAEEVRQTLIFSGHHDSAPICNINPQDETEYKKRFIFPVVSYLLLELVSLMMAVVELSLGKFFGPNFPTILMLILAIPFGYMVPAVYKLKNYLSDQVSPGAGDNLISSSMTIELANYFSWLASEGKGLKNTRLKFVSFDAEEEGARGSKAFFEQHKDELNQKVYMLNMDCPYKAEELTFLTSDANGTKKLSQRFAGQCVNLARSMGYVAKSRKMPFLGGGTDAFSAVQNGITATTLMAVSWDDETNPPVYHTANDTVDKIEAKAVETTLSVAIKLAQHLDGEVEDTPIVKPEPTEEKSLKYKFKGITKKR